MNPIRRARLLATTFLKRAEPLLLPSSIYSRARPSPQEGIELFRGEWTSRLPGFDSGGTALLFEGDDRPAWMARKAEGEGEGRVAPVGADHDARGPGRRTAPRVKHHAGHAPRAVGTLDKRRDDTNALLHAGACASGSLEQ